MAPGPGEADTLHACQPCTRNPGQEQTHRVTSSPGTEPATSRLLMRSTCLCGREDGKQRLEKTALARPEARQVGLLLRAKAGVQF